MVLTAQRAGGCPGHSPLPVTPTHTHAHTHLSLNSLYLFSRIPRELRLSQEPAEPPGTPETSGAFLGMQGARQEVLARMAARQRDSESRRHTPGRCGHRTESAVFPCGKNSHARWLKEKPQAVRTALSTAGPHVGRLSVMQYKRADEPLLERMWIYLRWRPPQGGMARNFHSQLYVFVLVCTQGFI